MNAVTWRWWGRVKSRRCTKNFAPDVATSDKHFVIVLPRHRVIERQHTGDRHRIDRAFQVAFYRAEILGRSGAAVSEIVHAVGAEAFRGSERSLTRHIVVGMIAGIAFVISLGNMEVDGRGLLAFGIDNGPQRGRQVAPGRV